MGFSPSHVVTRRPLEPPLLARAKLADRWRNVDVVATIQQNGATFNEIILPAGLDLPGVTDGRLTVPNSMLKFRPRRRQPYKTGKG